MLLTRSQNAGRALAGVDSKTNGGSEQQDVAERIGDRDCVRKQREVLEVDVRRNQEDPGEQADADRQDQRIDQCGPIRARTSPSDENEQSGHEHRINEEVERVADRGKADIGSQ